LVEVRFFNVRALFPKAVAPIPGSDFPLPAGCVDDQWLAFSEVLGPGLIILLLPSPEASEWHHPATFMRYRPLIILASLVGVVLLLGAIVFVTVPYQTITAGVNRRDGGSKMRVTYYRIWDDWATISPSVISGLGTLTAPDEWVPYRTMVLKFPWTSVKDLPPNDDVWDTPIGYRVYRLNRVLFHGPLDAEHDMFSPEWIAKVRAERIPIWNHVRTDAEYDEVISKIIEEDRKLTVRYLLESKPTGVSEPAK
jgi:hypothetical protein